VHRDIKPANLWLRLPLRGGERFDPEKQELVLGGRRPVQILFVRSLLALPMAAVLVERGTAMLPVLAVALATAMQSLPGLAAPLPVYFVGVGESVDDLEAFDPDAFVDALLARD